MDREEILARLRERIMAYAASRMQKDAAEDLAQEVLVVLEERYGDIDRLEELVPLSLQILRFKLAGARRKAHRRGSGSELSVEDVPLLDTRASPEDYACQQQMLQRLSEALERLPQRCREIFRLKLLGKSFAEIQDELDAASINTVYTWDARCRKKLLDSMGGKWEGE